MNEKEFTKSRIITVISPKGNTLKVEASDQTIADEFIRKLSELYPVKRLDNDEVSFETSERVYKVYVNPGYIEEPCRCGRITCGRR